MATLVSTKQNTSGIYDAGNKRFARIIDVIVDLSTDAVMGTATDDISLMTLAGGTMILSLTVQQISVSTGTGTLVGRAGAVTLTGTLASTDAINTYAATVPAALPYTVPAAGAQLNLLGATAVRTTGKVRVVAVLLAGDVSPRESVVATRDAI